MPEEEAIKPCWHMRLLVNRFAEGSLRGLVLAYVEYHLAHCGRCRRAVEAIKSLRNRLREFKDGPATEEIGDDRWARIRDEMDR